jgi:hypothetical protein
LLLLTLPLAWLLSLLGQTPQERFIGVPEVPVLPEPAAGTAPLPWLEALRSLIFWLLAAAIGWYFLKIYLNDHPELVEWLKSFKPIGFIANLLAYLWERFIGLAQAGLELIPKRAAGAGQAGQATSMARRRWAGLGGLSPRERILYYYLNILDRVAKHGPARRSSQTPYEYEPDLSQSIPEAQAAINALTEAFVRARYSREPWLEPQADLAKTLWQQIRRELRRSSDRNEKNP